VTETLSRRALNRATLARQHLLARVAMPVPAMIEHLVGMQAQVPRNPYLALWSRLEGFVPEELEALMTDRRTVRTPLMRATIHLATADDCLALRPTIQPVLDRGFTSGSPFGRNLRGMDVDAVVAAGRALVDEHPRTGVELRHLLGEQWPDRDAASLAAAVTYRLPMVQITPRGLWDTSSRTTWTTTETWLGRALGPALPLDALMLRYLAAFGPASVMDMQKWCGLTRLREVADRLRPELRVFRDAGGRELLDLPDGPRPDEATPAPPRFLPEYDNVLLGHADRTRFFNDDARVSAPDGVNSIQGSVLVDGQFGAFWNLRRPSPGTAALVVRPVWSWTAEDRSEVGDEAVGRAGRHEPVADRVEGGERRRLEPEVVDAAPPEHGRLAGRLLVARDLEHVELRVRADVDERQPPLVHDAIAGDGRVEHLDVEPVQPVTVVGEGGDMVDTVEQHGRILREARFDGRPGRGTVDACPTPASASPSGSARPTLCSCRSSAWAVRGRTWRSTPTRSASGWGGPSGPTSPGRRSPSSSPSRTCGGPTGSTAGGAAGSSTGAATAS
jgi:hypothetical protein